MHDLRDFNFAQPNIQKRLLDRGQFALRVSGVYGLSFGALLLVLAWLKIGYRDIFVPLGTVALILGLVQLVRTRRGPQTYQFRLCSQCGYNLTGNKSGRCPECGARA